MATSVAWSDTFTNYGANQDSNSNNTGASIIAFEQSVNPDWLRGAQVKLENLINLSENWDTYGALPVQPLSIQYAIILLNSLVSRGTPEPSIVPTPSGNVQIEWHINQIDLEIVFFPDSTIKCYFENLNSDDGPIEMLVSYDWRELEQLIDKLS